MSFIETIKQRARSDVKTIVLPESEDDRTILAAAKVLAEGTAAPVIIGTEEEVMGAAARLNAAPVIINEAQRPLISFFIFKTPYFFYIFANLS